MRLLIALILFCTFISAGYTQNYDFKKDITEEALQERVHPKDSTAEAAYIFSRGEVSFKYLKGWEFQFDVEKRIKIYNQSKFEGTTIKIPYYKGENNQTRERITSIKAYVYNLDGNKVNRTKIKSSDVYDEDINAYYAAKVFTFPEINDGTIIEYTYTLTSPHYSSMPRWYFQEQIPVNYSEFWIKTPEYFKYREFTKGFLNIDKETDMFKKDFLFTYKKQADLTSDNYNARKSQRTGNVNIETNIETLKYTTENVPKILPEEHIYNLDNYRSSIKHELMMYKEPGDSKYRQLNATWEDVAKSIHNNSNFGNELQRKGYFEDAINPIVQSAEDDMQKAMQLFSFVKQHMKWNEENGITSSGNLKKSFNEKTGNVADINLMLTAMMRHANLTAHPVLLSTRSHGIPISPTIQGFNYVITALRINDQVILFDASDPFSAPNLLHEKTMNWSGRLVTPDGRTMEIDLQPKVTSSDNINMFINFDDTGKLEGNMRRQMSNFIGMNHRRIALRANKESYVEALENYYDGIDIVDHSFDNLELLTSPLVETLKFEMNDACEKVGDKLFINPLLFLATKKQPFVSLERNYPIDFSYPKSERFIIIMNIPEGMKVDWVPEDAKVSLPNNVGSFQYLTQVNGNQVQINVIKQMNASILPSDYYLYLKEFYEVLVQKETDQIILTKA